jgi:hemerythrin
MSVTSRMPAVEVAESHGLIDRAWHRTMLADDNALAACLEALGDELLADFAGEEILMERFGYPFRADHMLDHSVGIRILSDAVAAARETRFGEARKLGLGALQDWSRKHRTEADAAFLEWAALSEVWRQRGEGRSDARLAAE